jgi:ABC-2 type transport system permease protein
MRQINAGIKKELMSSWRKFFIGGMLIVFFGCSFFLPGMSALILAVGEMDLTGIDEQMGIDSDSFGAMVGLYEGESGLFVAYSGTISMFTSAGLLAVLILMISTAGGEQKKRSIIIPQTAGLTAYGYVLPKFLFYPPIVFAATVGFMFLTNSICYAVFDVAYPLEIVAVTAVLTGFSMMFSLCLYLFFGIVTATPGLSVLYVLAANLVFTETIPAFGINRFTPFSLEYMSNTIILNHMSDADMYSRIGQTNVWITAGITLFLCLVLMLLTLFAMVAKRMDNTADEVY